MSEYWLLAIVLLPLLGALLNGAIALSVATARRHAPAAIAGAAGGSAHEPVVAGGPGPAVRTLVSLIGVVLPFASAAIGWALFAQMMQPTGSRLVTVDLGPWFSAGGLDVHWSFMLDPLSMVMVLVVTTVGSFIHLYSIGYMAEDVGYARYFAYLNLFLAAMLVLVMARDLVLMFVGWEGVGVCSYLLIGFWFDDGVKATAGLKAFVVNRVGDFGFLLGMFLLWWSLVPTGGPTFDLLKLPGVVSVLSGPTATAIALLLFVGAVGKSAQIPLHVWLPDAMAGPTPVSALIHAATMVTAGVYMVSRMHVIYELSHYALPVIGLIGGVTALMAATVACAQTNIKRVIAWSTISQLGYMFMALAAGSYAYGIFHLVTHAFFKGLFFLSAGAVIHALHGEEDLSRMGGLWKVPQLKGTAIAFGIAALANAGLVPLSGFVSKDAIILSLANHQMPVVLALAWVTAFLTAFYSVRLLMLVFAGDSRDPHLAEKAHQPGWSMGIALGFLSIGAVVVGGLNWPVELGGQEWFSTFLAPVFGGPVGGPLGPEPHADAVVGITTALVLLGILVAWLRYREPAPTLGSPWPKMGAIWTFFERKWYIDELYGAIVVRPALALAQGFSTALDSFLDAVADAFAELYDRCARVVQLLETGRVRSYGFVMVLGTLALLVVAVVTGRR